MPIAAENELTFKVEGMSCSHCVNRVRKALGETPGVLEATVDLDTGRASVRATEGVEPAQLVSAVAKAGYEAQPL